ncbi:MAG: N-6 DNA methylase [Prevotella sp.]|nr:N-6 DNA methylase [Prevotella sp.]
MEGTQQYNINRESLRTFLGSSYQGVQSFLDNIFFPIFGTENYIDQYCTDLLQNQPELLPMANATGIKAIKIVGSMMIEVQTLEILDITVDDNIMMERSRVNIQQLVRKVMEAYSCAFMIFHYENSVDRDWRFSFCHKGGTNDSMTDSKRYTFLLGPGQACRTATDNFLEIYRNQDNISIELIKKAFSVEALSKEFFGKYKDKYNKFVSYMENDKTILDEFIDKTFDKSGMTADEIADRERKPIRDYVKKLLGRIVFLHFIQKKGWLGVKTGNEWGSGDTNFMMNLFEKASDGQKADFLDSVLEPLYANALDLNRANKNDVYDTQVKGIGKIRIPYLNGGLFERDVLDEKKAEFPAEFFSELLEMFAEYNFTIDENDPNDAEIGVDPEMLGRIFENLLEDNKDKGAFYTPKEIVQYMCRESLIAYLQNGFNENEKKIIRDFVNKPYDTDINDIKDKILKRLKDVKILDPAIGSGAFPMGLLRELFACRNAIENTGTISQADIKREIIQNNIYGVDIERGAVDIARLRFWLALVVDETEPTTLPNLDYKIMQGNSLLESYHGIDLSILTEKKMQIFQPQRNLFGEIEDSQLKLTFTEEDYSENLQSLINDYYGTDQHQIKAELNKKIDDIIRHHLLYNLDMRLQQSQRFEDSILKTSDDKPTPKQEKEIEKQRDIQKVYSQLIAEVKNIDLQSNEHFFLWHTYFKDVFDNEGFDIVIGNPPYISAPTQIANPVLLVQRQRIIDSNKYDTLNEKWDLYIPFMEFGMQSLSPNGIFTMIVPYPLTNQKYGKKMREMINEEYRLLEIVDLNGTKVFENATVSNCIPFIQKSEPFGEVRISQINDDKKIYEVRRKTPSMLIQDDDKYVWNLSDEIRSTNRFPEMNVLGDFCYISKGMVLNADEKTAKGDFKKDDLISDHFDEIHSRKYIEAKDIDKYKVKRERYLEWNTERCPDKLSRPTFRELYDCPKLVINRLGELKVYIDIDTHYLHSDSMFCAVLWKDLKGVSNKSITSSIKKFCNYKRYKLEQISKGVNLYYLLGILNSSTAALLLADQRGGDYHIYPEHIRKIPIPSVSIEQQTPIINLVKCILSIKCANPQADISEQQRKIDSLVSQLYGLTAEEIAFIEKL